MRWEEFASFLLAGSFFGPVFMAIQRIGSIELCLKQAQRNQRAAERLFFESRPGKKKKKEEEEEKKKPSGADTFGSVPVRNRQQPVACCLRFARSHALAATTAALLHFSTSPMRPQRPPLFRVGSSRALRAPVQLTAIPALLRGLKSGARRFEAIAIAGFLPFSHRANGARRRAAAPHLNAHPRASCERSGRHYSYVKQLTISADDDAHGGDDDAAGAHNALRSTTKAQTNRALGGFSAPVLARKAHNSHGAGSAACQRASSHAKPISGASEAKRDQPAASYEPSYSHRALVYDGDQHDTLVYLVARS